ncbi:hypothetical protein [Bacillus suaedae]|nr:hypothetical protein [Bacillus suaedae]
MEQNKPSKEALRNVAQYFLKTSVPRILKRKRAEEQTKKSS